MNAADPEYPAELVTAVDSLFARPTPDLHDAIEDLFAAETDWDDLVLDVMNNATDIEATTAALVVFAPHLDVIEGDK